MPKTTKWIQPTPENVRGFWLLVRDGRFKNSNGLPKFQLTRGVGDPDEVIISWAYGSDSVVRCPIDDIPAYLNSEPLDSVARVLKRIARRDLRKSRLLESQPTVRDQIVLARKIFEGELSKSEPPEDARPHILDAFYGTLDEMAARDMFSGM